jgi:hypothetical protein
MPAQIFTGPDPSGATRTPAAKPEVSAVRATDGFDVAGQAELEFDLRSAAGPRLEPQPLCERTGGAVLPQRRRDQDRKPVLARATHERPREDQTDPQPVHVVGNLDRHVGRLRSLRTLHVSSHADDRAIKFIDGRDRLMPDVINLGEVREFPVAQRRPWSQEAPATRLHTHPHVQRCEIVAVAGPEWAN